MSPISKIVSEMNNISQLSVSRDGKRWYNVNINTVPVAIEPVCTQWCSNDKVTETDDQQKETWLKTNYSQWFRLIIGVYLS